MKRAAAVSLAWLLAFPIIHAMPAPQRMTIVGQAPPASSGASVARVGAAGTASLTYSGNVVLPQTPTTGHIVVIAVGIDYGGSPTVPSVTDSLSNAVNTTVVSATSSGYAGAHIYCYVVPSPAPGATYTVTSTGGNGHLAVYAQEYSGATCTPTDGSSALSGSTQTGTSVTGTAITTSVKDLVFAIYADRWVGTTTITATAPWNAVGTNLQFSGAIDVMAEDRINVSAGTYTATFGVPSGTYYPAVATAAFKAQ